ncbi:MAG: hypothetical protein ACRYHA_09530 [Janthinobacterium lividum]
MLSFFGIIASCNVLFVAWRMWVARRYPRDAAPRGQIETAGSAARANTIS